MPSSVVHSFIDGLNSSLYFNKVVLILSRSTAVRRCMLTSMVVNTLLWSGGWLLLNLLFTETVPVLFGWSYSFVTSHLLYLLCLCVNSVLFDQLAKETIQVLHYGTSSTINYRPIITPTKTLTSSIYLVIFYGNCALLVNLVRLVPYIGGVIGFPLTSIVLGYYCFEYKWIDLGWTQEHRLSFVEYHWPYFFGFGLPLALATFFFSTLQAGAIFSFAFPIFVILATMDVPTMDSTQSIPMLPVFFGLRTLNKLSFALIQVGHTRIFDHLMAQDRKDTLGKLV